MPEGRLTGMRHRVQSSSRDPLFLLLFPSSRLALPVLLACGCIAGVYLLTLLHGAGYPPIPHVFDAFYILSYVAALCAYAMLWTLLVRLTPVGPPPYVRPALWGSLAAGGAGGLCGAAVMAALGTITVPGAEIHVAPGWVFRPIEGLAFSALHATACAIIARRHG